MEPTLTMRERAQIILAELPGAAALAVLTAIATLALAVVLSAVLGQERREDAYIQRCFAAQTVELLREVVAASDTLSERIDLTDFPPIPTGVIDCKTLLNSTQEDLP